jgi:hypothetical protein
MWDPRRLTILWVSTACYRGSSFITNKEDAKIETAEMKFLRSAAGYIRKDQIPNTKIMEELNIIILNDRILKSRSQWKYHLLRKEDRRIS